ncbi:MAG: hypothetical protein JNL74_03735 [Fibrobacteres bacterium]|nr:hypothetical protein [Fibrobacterota bacterium]
MKSIFAAVTLLSITIFSLNTNVSTVATLRTAVNAVNPGDTVTLAPGTYAVGGDFLISRGGSEAAGYVVIRAAARNTVTISGNYGDQMMLVDKKYVVLENLTLDGGPSYHCLHIKPGAGHLIVRNCTFVGCIDKSVKNSSPVLTPESSTVWQDYMLFENCEGSAGSRNQAIGMLNINGPDYLTVRGCHMHNYSLTEGYACFLKAGGKYPVYENNLVRDCFVGLSFGGGTTGSDFQRRGSVEAFNGIARNNVVVRITDVGLHCNKVTNCRFLNNTLIQTAGIQNQNSSTGISAINNIIMGGSVKSGIISTSNITTSYEASFFWAPDSYNYRLKSSATILIGKGTNIASLCPTDLLGKARPVPPSVGAYEVYSSANEMPIASEIIPENVYDGSILSIGPNPISRSAVITVTLSNDAELMDLGIVTPEGRSVFTFKYGKAAKGRHLFNWNGKNHEGKSVAGGRYLLRLRTDKGNQSRIFTVTE